MPQNEEKQKWAQVTNLLHPQSWLVNPSWLKTFQKFPFDFTQVLSYYKFAAKTLATNQKILELNCGTGMGINILTQFAKSYVGLEDNQSNVSYLQKNLIKPKFQFLSHDEFKKSEDKSSFDSILQIDLDETTEFNNFFFFVKDHLKTNGKALLGTKVNSQEAFKRLKAKIEKVFELVVCFSFRNEICLCTEPALNEYGILLGCSKKW